MPNAKYQALLRFLREQRKRTPETSVALAISGGSVASML